MHAFQNSVCHTEIVQSASKLCTLIVAITVHSADTNANLNVPCCPAQVFDDKNQFAEWFGDSFGKTAPGAGGEDDVAMEKRVVVIHRLHQILEPFMLRRQVQDVEGKLPPKVSVIHMAASQRVR